MSHHDMPPLYSHVSHADTHPVPEYTELAPTSERVLHRSSTDPEGSRALSGARDYRYRTDNVEITVGPNPWGLLYAAYGRGGVVKGSVTFIKKAPAVLQVTATLKGSVNITTSEHSMVAGVSKKTLLEQKIILFDTSTGATIPCCTVFPFEIAFPEHTADGDIPLPPSCSVFHPGASAEISYVLQIDIVRGTFYRHEMRAIQVLYLPKSSPEHPPVLEMPLVSLGLDLAAGTKKVSVPPTWTEGQSPNVADKDLAEVLAFFPEPCVFASGEDIPLALSIRCPLSPAIPKLLSDNIGIFLIRRKKVWINEGRQISVREVVVEKVTELHVNRIREGTMYLTTHLAAGKHGSECSWGIPRFMLVEYVIRIVVRPPAYAKHLPVYKHDEVVRLCTDSYGTLSRELLSFHGVPMPALGLSNMINTRAPAVRQ